MALAMMVAQDPCGPRARWVLIARIAGRVICARQRDHLDLHVPRHLQGRRLTRPRFLGPTPSALWASSIAAVCAKTRATISRIAGKTHI